ncbi:hypothetical protein [Paraburkholderia sp. RL17-337-BIB-A]|uniref:hypothetical protein n=1 Tax=Paraburkholderia sp. RL17-337-BIB-A TaxID=3031636 RepID=UPI0038BBA4D1
MIVAADLLSQIIVNMLDRIFKLICLAIAIFYFGSGPIRVLLYTQPERGMLKYSAGVVELRKKYRGAEYVTLRERSGLHIYQCGYYLWGLGVGFCPLEIRGGDKINGKDVVIGRYERRSKSWGVSQRQIFEMSAHGNPILNFSSAAKYYEKQNSKITCSFLLASTLAHRLIHKSALRNRRPEQTVVGQ